MKRTVLFLTLVLAFIGCKKSDSPFSQLKVRNVQAIKIGETTVCLRCIYTNGEDLPLNDIGFWMGTNSNQMSDFIEYKGREKSFEVTVNDLKPNTKYNYQAYLGVKTQNKSEGIISKTHYFTTKGENTVNTLAADNISPNTATLAGKMIRNDKGGLNSSCKNTKIYAYEFAIGTSKENLNQSHQATYDPEKDIFTLHIEELTPDTKYHLLFPSSY